MSAEPELTSEERKAVEALINESDLVLLEILGRLEAKESASYGAAPPSADELKRLGLERFQKWQMRFCCEGKSNQAVASLLKNEGTWSLFEKVMTVVGLFRGADLVDTTIFAALAARQGLVALCKDIHCK